MRSTSRELADDTELFSEVIGSFYDAALDADIWPEALRQACRFIEGASASLVWRDTIATGAAVFHTWGFDPAYQQSYFEHYASLDVFVPAVSFQAVGQVYSAGDLVPLDEYHESRIFREWVKPQGYVDFCNVNLETSKDAVSTLVVQRSQRQGFCDEATKQRVGLLFPHLKRAVTIGRTLEFHKAAASSIMAILDHVSAPVMFTAEGGRIVHANDAAKNVLASAQILRAQEGCLRASIADADAALRQAIDGLNSTESNAARLSGASVTLENGAGQRYVASLMSLAGVTRQEVMAPGATVAIFLRPEIAAAPAPLKMAAKAYKLTASEIRMLAAVAAEGGSTAELAERLGIAVSTAKTHLLHLYSKTGAKRQADLLRLLAGFKPETAA